MRWVIFVAEYWIRGEEAGTSGRRGSSCGTSMEAAEKKDNNTFVGQEEVGRPPPKSLSPEKRLLLWLVQMKKGHTEGEYPQNQTSRLFRCEGGYRAKGSKSSPEERARPREVRSVLLTNLRKKGLFLGKRSTKGGGG